ncbi:MAG: hypothetical protein ACRDL0_17420 [Thermoleophilaceae bacterium]
MSDRELLERHKPVLIFDPQYDYRALGASSALANPGNLLLREHGEVIARSPLELDALATYAPEAGDFLALAADFPGDAGRMEWEEPHRGRIYGRVKRDGGRIWLQYWFWLYYNPKNLFGFGKHEGDWEMVQIGLGDDEKPEVANYAQHDSGEARPWRNGPMDFKEDDPDRPVVYVAPLSHASYFKPGTHPYLLGIDDPRADGPPANLSLAAFGDWATWPGRWGNPERSFLGRVGRGPNSPGHQGAKWDAPDAWHRRLRYRKLRVLLGRAAHGLGALTFPHPPATLRADLAGERVTVDYELAGGGRGGRHLYLTLHQGHLVVANRIVRDAPRQGQTSLRIPDGRQPTALMASVYNRLRQRSEPAREPLA